MVEAKAGLLARLVGVVKRFGAGALGVLGLSLSVYFFWYQEYGKVGEVAVAIKAEGSVLTVQRQVPDLDIVYRGSSLLSAGNSLRFYSVQITNSGPVHILKPYFDDQVPWGFRLKGAEILQISNIEYKVPALENTRPALSGPDAVRLQPVNFDTGDWVRIDFLALVAKNAEPSLEPTGRISGTSLTVRNEIPGGSYFDQAFGGSTFVQLGRMIGYALLFLLALIGIAITAAFVTSIPSGIKSLSRRAVVRRAERFATLTPASNNAEKALRSIYIGSGLEKFQEAVLTLTTPESIRRIESIGRRMSRTKVDAAQATIGERVTPSDAFDMEYNFDYVGLAMDIVDRGGKYDPSKGASAITYATALLGALRRQGDEGAARVLEKLEAARSTKSPNTSGSDEPMATAEN